MLSLLKQYLWVLNLVAILFCSFFAAKLTSLYIESRITVEGAIVKPLSVAKAQAPTREIVPSSAYKIILERNIFDSTELPPEEAPVITEGNAVPTGEAVKTSLSIKVVGVMVVGEGKDKRSSATISGQGGSADTYAVGDENGFAPGTKLTRVQPDRIEFLHKGRLEFALIEDESANSIFGPPPSETTAMATPASAAEGTSETIKKEGENKFVIDQKEVQNALGNIERLYTDIRAVPNFAGGKVSGMKILSVKQGSLFDKLGLQRGDVLQKINGLELDVKKGFEIFSQLKSETHLSVDLVREGRNQTFDYEIR